jgi:hypothetical protein
MGISVAPESAAAATTTTTTQAGIPSKESVAEVKSAGKAFLAGLTEEQRNAPIADPVGTEEVVDDKFEQPAGDTTGTQPAAAADTVLAITREDGAIWDETQTKWRDKAGKFVEGEAPTADELTALAAEKAKTPAATTEAAKVDDPAADEEKWIKVTLPGLSERGEKDLEAEVSPELADRITRLKNDGMRRKAFDEQMQFVERSKSELQAIEEALSVDPVGFTLGRMTPERQLEVAEALLIEHFETLAPKIEQYWNDAAQRQGARVQFRDRMRENGQQLTETQQKREYAGKILSAARQLLPESVEPSVAQSFLRDAERDLIDAARSGATVAPETVPQLLQNRLKLYGLHETPAAPGGSTTTTTTPATQTARPVTDRARTIAEVKQGSARIRRVQTQRLAATRVAPTGAGAAPVQIPVIPQDADIRGASRIIRKQGVQGWPTAP